MKGYYEGYSYVGFMPDGRKMRFATDTEYREAYAEEARPSLFASATWARTIIERNRLIPQKQITKQYF